MKKASAWAVLAASLVVAGCCDNYKKMQQDTLARAQKAEQQQAQTAQDLDKVKAENAKLESTVKKLSGEVGAAKKSMDELQAAAQKAGSVLEEAIKERKDAQGQLREVTAALKSLKALVQEKDAKIAQLEQVGKDLQKTVEKLKVEVLAAAASKVQPATPGAGTAVPPR